MAITIERLTSAHALSLCEQLQQEISGVVVAPIPLMVAVQRSGGLIIGARDDTSPEQTELCGVLIDLAGPERRAPSCRCRQTVFHGVKREIRNRGVGRALRLHERKEAGKEGVSLITWPIDPLRSLELHMAFNKLAAIATTYERNLYGVRQDPRDRGLATDRLTVEWWIDSPRVTEVIDKGRLPHHFHLGLNQMEVVTKTRPAANGLRRLLSFEESPTNRIILVEIPVDLDRMREEDLPLARDWRLKTRDMFERLLSGGYTITGFIHEAGRSFHLLERAEKGTILERTPVE